MNLTNFLIMFVFFFFVTACGHCSPADQIQHVCKRHRQMGLHTSPRGGPERPHAALRSPAGPWSWPHHEEPRGPDGSGPGHGMALCRRKRGYVWDWWSLLFCWNDRNVFLQADDIRALLMDAMPPDALPSCFKPQATVVSASVISPASTPSCLSAASSIDNLAGPLTELAAAAAAGASGVADGASGTDRKEGESRFTVMVTGNTRQFNKCTMF